MSAVPKERKNSMFSSFRKLAQFVVAGIVCAAITGSMAQSSHKVNGSGDDWRYYGHDAGGMRYSPLTQINRENVATLKVAWTFHVGDISDGSGGKLRPEVGIGA